MKRHIATRRGTVVLSFVAGITTIAVMVGALRAEQPQRPAANESRYTQEDVDLWMSKLSNWGRWGKDDQLGAAHLMTPAKRSQAAGLVKTGQTVSMSRTVRVAAGTTTVDGGHPFAHRAEVSGETDTAMEVQHLFFHGGTFTHLDALCHMGFKGKVYNGLSFKDVVDDTGCSKLGVMALKDGIVTRAVLIDIARLKGVPYLEPGTHVYRQDIEAWEKQAGVRISSGDALLLRTGRSPQGGSGFDGSVIPFLKERDVALIGSDGVQDVGPFPGVPFPIHRFALAALGAHLIDNMDLEAVAEVAARLKRWEFMLTAAPTPVMNGTGSIINPIAVF